MKWPKFIILQIVLLLSCSPLLGWGADSYYRQEALILDDLRSAVDQYGPRAFNTVESRLRLADFYIASEEYHKAEPLLHQVRGMMEKRLGVGNVKLVSILEKQADLDARQNRFVFALNSLQRALGIATRKYGRNRAKTKKIRTAIADTRNAEREWKRLGRKAAAAPTKSRIPSSSRSFQAQTATLSDKLAAMSKKKAETKGRAAKVASKKQRKVVQKKPAAAVVKKPVVTRSKKVAAVASKRASAQVSRQQASSALSQTKTTTRSPGTSSFPMNLDAEGIPRDPGAEHKKGFYISMGCFSDKPFAIGQVKRVMGLSLPVYMKSLSGDKMHCVFGGPFPTKSAATEGAARSRNEARVADTLVKRYK
jgi:hypothetical protein